MLDDVTMLCKNLIPLKNIRCHIVPETSVTGKLDVQLSEKILVVSLWNPKQRRLGYTRCRFYIMSLLNLQNFFYNITLQCNFFDFLNIMILFDRTKV